MQKRSFFISFILFIAVTSYVGYYLFYIVPSDIKKYQQEEEKRKNDSGKKNKNIDGTQYRESTSKEIYSADFPFRLHTHIEASYSTLHFFSTQFGLQVKEKLIDLDGIVEEKILMNELGQLEKTFKKFHAESGIYDYQKKELITHAISLEQQKQENLASFILNKKALSIYSAKAAHASFKLDSNAPSFHADKVEMTLHQTEFR